ncbi:hypothetical protein BJ875DRAFT_373780 [Amylocarpus encephaloides]|uniref:Thioester reductase (TE) domain-containing protein n=1 Tax=Amylocarpus encephaloides TaxID=45428 RepID=A0A9P7YKS7_9HELO|nr:hypothetical protein BJ875DRAFT_373780 [Amylocarpus encephaloides]
MKIILTGATGMIGLEVLAQCIKSPSVTQIIVLIRKPLPESTSTSPKIRVIIHENFLSYPDSVLQQLSGAQACIWAQGVVKAKTCELQREINVTYPLTFIEAIRPYLRPELLSQQRKFNFIYISGLACERNMDRKLWVLSQARKIKGEMENHLIAQTGANTDTFAGYITRPGSVIPPNSKLMDVLGVLTSPIYPVMKVEELAVAMIDISLNGLLERSEDVKLEDYLTIMHDELQRRGREILKSGL